jgi:hypothetical protein
VLLVGSMINPSREGGRSPKLVVASLVGGVAAHFLSTASWVVLEGPYVASVIEVPIRALLSGLFAPYLAVIYAVIGGAWMAGLVALRLARSRRALTVVAMATTPFAFVLAAVLVQLVLRGTVASLPLGSSFLVYFVVAPVTFGGVTALLVGQPGGRVSSSSSPTQAPIGASRRRSSGGPGSR